MTAHSKSLRAPLGLALGAGCMFAAPLFVAPGHRGQPSSSAAPPSAQAEEPIVSEQQPASGSSVMRIAGLGLLSSAALAARMGRTAAGLHAQEAKAVVTRRAFETELGVQAPVGFWDPLGFTNDGDQDAFRRRRETEIKHGRISMLATMGYITPELTGKFPGYLSPSLGVKYEDIPNGLAAISKVPLAGWFQIVLYCLYCEASGLGFGYFEESTKGEPGDLGFKPPLLATSDPELKSKRLNAELANGRLAMMAIIGMFFHSRNWGAL